MSGAAKILNGKEMAEDDGYTEPRCGRAQCGRRCGRPQSTTASIALPEQARGEPKLRQCAEGAAGGAG
jgi:hypothetical protein